MDDGDVVAQVLDEVELVAGEDDDGAAFGLCAYDVTECLDPELIEAREWLIEDQQVGFVGEGDDELNPLLVAVGQLFEARVRTIGEAEAAEPVICGGGGVGGRHAV